MHSYDYPPWAESPPSSGGGTGPAGANGMDGGGNKIKNGNFSIDQRSPGIIALSSTASFMADRWLAVRESPLAISAGKTNNVVDGNGLGKFWNFFTATCGVGGIPAAGQRNRLYQFIEGLDINDLNFGTALAGTFTISFWARASKVGTYCLSFTNKQFALPDRSYVSTYTIAVANTWEFKNITITADVSGTWNRTSSYGACLSFDLGSNDASFGTVPANINTWLAGEFYTLNSGITKLNDTTGNNLAIANVDLRVGTSAPSTFDHSDQLARCQRDCCIAYSSTMQQVIGNTIHTADFPVEMRIIPTTITNISVGTLTNALNVSELCNSTRNGRVTTNITAAGGSVLDRKTRYETGW